MFRDDLNKILNNNLWYIAIDIQKKSITVKKGGDIKKLRFINALTDQKGIMISRVTKDQIDVTLNQILSMFKTYENIINRRNEIVNIFKTK